MPEENIVEMASKCRVLLLDIEGTTTSISFVKEKLFPYAEANVRSFLEEGWEEEEVRAAADALRKLSVTDIEDKVEGAVPVPAEDASKEEQVDGLVKSVKWLMSVDRKAGPLKLLQGLIWKQAYDKGDIQGHVYEDVAGALEEWRSDSRKVYIYSSGSEQAQKLLFRHSCSGDLLPHVDGHFDTAVGGKQEADSYTAIAKKIDCEPGDILFLTDIIKEAEAARSAGLRAALVVREGNAPLPSEHTFPVLSSLAELRAADKPDAAATTAKRKQEQQEEQPAKVAKASLDDDVKSTTVESTAEETTKHTDKMDVDAAPAVDTEAASEIIKDGAKDELVSEKVTETSAKETAPAVAEPIAEPVKEMQTENKTEVESKTEETAADVKETQTAAAAEPIVEEAMEAEESPPIITEIEDVTDKKCEEEAETLSIEPVVEEPQDEDMEVLQNVGDVLEKECDEILSKVKDVTELVQPLLASIEEETEAANAELESAPTGTAEQTPTQTEPEDEVAAIRAEVAEEPAKTNVETTESPKETLDEPVKPESSIEEAASAKPSDNGANEATEPEKTRVNGDTETKDTNGVKLNGDSNGEERLADNGDGAERVNGSNGEAKEAGGGAGGENGSAAATEDVPEIKVKSVPAAADSEPVQQPTDA